MGGKSSKKEEEEKSANTKSESGGRFRHAQRGDSTGKKPTRQFLFDKVSLRE